MFRRWEAAALVGLLAPSAFMFWRVENQEIRAHLLWAALASVACYLTTVWLIPVIAPYLLRRKLAGKDRGKMGTPAGEKDVPSALGLICGVVYMVFVIVTQLVHAKAHPTLLANYNAALLSICFMVLLGFADDVLDLPWRFKLILPTVASLPLLATYSGVTTVLLPKFARPLLWDMASDSRTWLGELVELFFDVDAGARGAIIDLGILFFVYMGMLAVFCTNAINIYAGINGLEAGQSLIIGVAVLTANMIELSAGVSASSPHLFSALLALPFIATTAGLLHHNVYPAAVFVGDTYCYFAGMTFAVMGILGHFSKTLLLFFIPQVFNFLYSLPQLFKVYPCPRHRMPDFDPAANTLLPSFFVPRHMEAAAAAEVAAATGAGGASGSGSSAPSQGAGALPASSGTAADVAEVADAPRLRKGHAKGKGAAANAASEPGSAAPSGAPAAAGSAAASTVAPVAAVVPPYRPAVARDNMTLINLVLRICGPIHERTAVNILLAIQAACCLLGLFIRYYLASALWFGAADGLGPAHKVAHSGSNQQPPPPAAGAGRVGSVGEL